MSKAKKNVVSLSGGKDSLATALVAIEREAENLSFVFADTGNEHQITYDYIDYLETKLGPIKRLRANFDALIANKRMYIARDQRIRRDKRTGKKVRWTNKAKRRALAALKPTGNPFLDLCIWKGRFPSTRARFCSERLKAIPLNAHLAGLSDDYDEVWSWIGIRWDESRGRADALELEESSFVPGLMIHRPILSWTAEDCFAIAKRHGIKPNPLYKEGMGRVGCMPCIHAGKNEVFEIAKRFPEEIARLAEWEKIVGQASKRGVGTFFDAGIVQRSLGFPPITSKNVHTVSRKTHGIEAYVDWSKTSRGGRQIDMMKVIDLDEPPACRSLYGLCE